MTLLVVQSIFLFCDDRPTHEEKTTNLFRLEFVPYVLQILGFLIESHPSKPTNLSDTYRTLFSSILNPAFWDRSGNIPALSRLVQAYIEKAGETIVLEKLVCRSLSRLFVSKRSFFEISHSDNCSWNFPTACFSIESLRSRRIFDSSIVDNSSSSHSSDQLSERHIRCHFHSSDKGENTEVDSMHRRLLLLLHG